MHTVNFSPKVSVILESIKVGILQELEWHLKAIPLFHYPIISEYFQGLPIECQSATITFTNIQKFPNHFLEMKQMDNAIRPFGRYHWKLESPWTLDYTHNSLEEYLRSKKILRHHSLLSQHLPTTSPFSNVIIIFTFCKT